MNSSSTAIRYRFLKKQHSYTPAYPPQPPRTNIPSFDTLFSETFSMYPFGVQGGKVRVLSVFQRTTDKKERIAALREELNNSGRTTHYGFVSYNSTGMLLSVYDKLHSTLMKGSKSAHYTWAQVEREVSRQIDTREFFDLRYKG